MNSGIILVVQLFIRAGQETEFQQFEQAAAQIMRKYEGRIEKVIRPLKAGPELPYEVHLVQFPSLEQFEAYREDPELAELAPLRQSAIARTEILIGQEVI